jgi:tRNA threonylcarbamoyladenosine biosynthesis protein TsaB
MRTDKPVAEVGLFEDRTQLAYIQWEAHRELSATLHGKIAKLLEEHQRVLDDLKGVVCFKGPGSFTGLRIGLTVANSLAYGLSIPVVSSVGDDWAEKGVAGIIEGQNEGIALPLYGAPVHITEQRK